MSDPGLCLQSQANKTLLEIYRGSMRRQKSPENPKNMARAPTAVLAGTALLSFPQYSGKLEEEQGGSREFGLGQRGLDVQADSNAGR